MNNNAPQKIIAKMRSGKNDILVDLPFSMLQVAHDRTILAVKISKYSLTGRLR